MENKPNATILRNIINIWGTNDTLLGEVEYLNPEDSRDDINMKLKLRIPGCVSRAKPMNFGDDQMKEAVLDAFTEHGRIPFKPPMVIKIYKEELIESSESMKKYKNKYIYIYKDSGIRGQLVCVENVEIEEIDKIYDEITGKVSAEEMRSKDDRGRIISWEEAVKKLRKIGIDLEASYESLSKDEQITIAETRKYSSIYGSMLSCLETFPLKIFGIGAPKYWEKSRQDAEEEKTRE